eukprot:9476059-Pyramimonas_sp.AAC.2
MLGRLWAGPTPLPSARTLTFDYHPLLRLIALVSLPDPPRPTSERPSSWSSLSSHFLAPPSYAAVGKMPVPRGPR